MRGWRGGGGRREALPVVGSAPRKAVLWSHHKAAVTRLLEQWFMAAPWGATQREKKELQPEPSQPY